MRDFEAEERINRALRARRRAEIRRRRRRRARIKRALVLGGTGLCLFLIILAGVGLVKAVFGRDAQAAEQAEQAGEENGKAGVVSGALASTGQLQNAIQQLQQSFQAEA